MLFVLYGSSKPTEKKTRTHQEEPLSQFEHNDDKNFDYDHEAFLGQDDAKTFDQLPPEESKRRLRWVQEWLPQVCGSILSASSTDALKPHLMFSSVKGSQTDTDSW